MKELFTNEQKNIEIYKSSIDDNEFQLNFLNEVIDQS